MPDTPLKDRIGNQWQLIGFQGSDPATDFRGMGLLGLDQLIFFAKKYPRHAQKALTTSRHPQHWYVWACVGINLTSWIMMLIRSRKLQLFFYSALQQYRGHPSLDLAEDLDRCLAMGDIDDEDDFGRPSVASRPSSPSSQDPVVTFLRESVHKFYCFVFTRFNHYWEERVMSLPGSEPAILHFPKIYADFQQAIELQLPLTTTRNAITLALVDEALLLNSEQ
jgi:hypothetical protein